MKKTTATSIKSSLEKLKRSDGWVLIEKDIDIQIASLIKQLRVRDENANKLAYTTHDVIREMIDNLEALKNTPDYLIRRYEGEIEYENDEEFWAGELTL